MIELPDEDGGERLRKALVLLAMVREARMLNDFDELERYDFFGEGLLQSVAVPGADEVEADLTKAGYDFIVEELHAARHPHQDVEVDRDQKREQLDRQQERAETAEAEVERLREAVEGECVRLERVNLREVEHMRQAVVEAPKNLRAALAPSPDDRGGERADG